MSIEKTEMSMLNLFRITNEGSSLACPQISITDEYNRQHNIAPSASSFDPVSIFQKNVRSLTRTK